MDDVDTLTREVREVRALVSPANPVTAQATATAHATPQAQQLLRAILTGARTPAPENLRGGLTSPIPQTSLNAPTATTPTHRPRPSRRQVLVGAAAGLATLGLAGYATVGALQPAQAAQPPVLPYSLPQGRAAAPRLLAIAAAAAAAPAGASGPYAYVRTASWNLNSATADGRTSSSLDADQSESWLAGDGTGLTLRRGGPSMAARTTSQQTYDALLGSGGSRPERVIYGEQGRTLFPPFDLASLPWRDPGAFARTVNRHETTTIPVAVDTVDAVRTLFTTQALDPQARSQTWTMLAALPQVSYRGPLQDRLGRAGEAFTVDDDGAARGLPVQVLLIVDPATGQLLESDEVLTTDPGRLGVPVPSVLSITVVVASGEVDAAEQRPT